MATTSVQAALLDTRRIRCVAGKKEEKCDKSLDIRRSRYVFLYCYTDVASIYTRCIYASFCSGRKKFYCRHFV